MDVQPQAPGEETGQDRAKIKDNLQNHCPQHAAKQPEAEYKEARLTDRAEKRYSDESITDLVYTNEDALLLPNHKPMISHTTDKDDLHFENSVVCNQPVAHPLQEGVGNRAPPICTPPVATAVQVKPGSASASTEKSNGHHHQHKKPLPSASKSQQSFKANAAQIQEVAGDGTLRRATLHFLRVKCQDGL